jgi:hypothetical protein
LLAVEEEEGALAPVVVFSMDGRRLVVVALSLTDPSPAAAAASASFGGLKK